MKHWFFSTVLAQEADRELAPELDLSQTNLPALTWNELFQTAIQWTAVIVAITTFASIVYSGYLLITSGNDPAQAVKAKTNLLWSIAGFLVAMFAYVLVRFVFNIGGALQG